MSDVERMTLWTLKSVLNLVVVKKLVGDWIKLAPFGKNSRQVHPLQALINYAKQSNLNPLAETLISNQENRTATFIQNSCRTEFRNLS